MRIKFIVKKEDRIDKVISSETQLSRSAIAELIENRELIETNTGVSTDAGLLASQVGLINDIRNKPDLGHSLHRLECHNLSESVR